MNKIKQKVIYRAPLNECSLPLGLRSVGYATIAPGLSTGIRETTFFQMIWSVFGEGYIRIEEQKRLVKQGWAIIYPPDTGHQLLTAGKRSWEYRWCTFDGVAVETLLAAFNLSYDAFPAGVCPEELFIRLGKSLENPSPEGERQAGVELYRFLTILMGQNNCSEKAGAKTPVQKILTDLALKVSNSKLCVQTLADEANLSRFSIHRIFKEELGTTPKHYIDSLRLQKAMGLLRNNNLPIHEIAVAAGFADANYFCKFFRRKTGFSPSRFRNEEHIP